MNRNQILIAALILVLSWTTVAAVTFAVTREITDYAPPFGDFDFDVCLNDRSNREWCDAYFTALEDTWDFLNDIDGATPSAAVAPSNENVMLVVVDRFSDGLVVYEAEPLPNGECPPAPSLETVVHLTAGQGPAGVTTSMNENCEIVIDEIK